MQRGEGDSWSGTINVAPAAQYLVTVTWVERLEEINGVAFNGRELPLAQLTQNLAVAADGSVVQSNTSEYSTQLNEDGDDKSNFDERESGSNPFENDNQTGSDDSSVDAPEQPTTPAAPTTPETDPLPNVPENPVQTPVVTPVVEPNTDATPDTDTSTEPADVIVPRIASASAPLIDGKNVTIGSQDELTGEWVAAVQFDNSGAPLTINNLIIDVDADAADGTAHRRWAAMHDGTYLYVLVLVDDDGKRSRDSTISLSDDDSLEIFIDGDNSKSSSYGTDDFHRLLPVRLAGADKQSASSGDIAGPNSSVAPLLLDFATGPGIGPDGIRRARFEQDVYEIRIKLNSANIDTDSAFGFELQVNDDDNGDDRDAKWAWKHTSSNNDDEDTISNPSLMGTLVLE